jgi:hypothetical protein
MEKNYNGGSLLDEHWVGSRVHARGIVIMQSIPYFPEFVRRYGCFPLLGTRLQFFM